MSKKRVAFWLCLCLLAPLAGNARILRDPLGSLVSNQSAPLVINEYLADPPTGPAGDANGDGVTSTSQDEFVELINAGSAPLGVGGFSISDAVQTRFTFPPGAVIPAGEAAIIFGGGSPRGDFGNARANGLVFTSALSLNNASDSIIIKDNFGAEVTRHDYPPPESDTNQSITRSPDINGNFVEHSTAQGSDGRLFSPGTLITGSAFTVAPSIARISPDRVPFRSPQFELSVEGSGFEAESKVFIDSSPVATSFINAGELTATVPESVTTVFGPHLVEVRNQGGNRSNTVTLTIIPPPPVLLSVLPRLVNVGTGNFMLFALGENFDAGSVVIVEETTLSTTRISSVELRATVPAAITATLGQRRVRVRNSDGQQSRDIGFEVVLPGVRVISITPAQVVAGGPQLALTVAGTNFRDGAVAILDQEPLPTRVISATVIQADVAAPLLAAPGLKGLRVQNSDGTISNELLFRVSPLAPLIHFIDPSTIIEGSGDRTITITGERFQPGAVARIDAPSGPRQRLDTIFINDSRLEASIKAELVEVAGKLSIIVENPDTGISNSAALNISIKNPLVVNEYLADPADGPEGDANGDGARSASQDEFVEIINRTSEAIDISGYRLDDAESVRHVFAAGTVVPPFEAVVVFGGGTAKGRFGNAAENNLVFRASTGGLSLNNGSDRVRLKDAEGRLIEEITYGAAEGGANQSINRDPDADGADFSLHTLVAGRGVLFSPGTRATGRAFTIKPAIHSLAPASVRRASAAFTIEVTGASFLSGAQVLFGQAALETDFISETVLEARVGAELITNGGAADVRVRNPKGEVSAVARFVITDDPPRIAELTPQRIGTFAEAIEITIRGERFQPGAIVLFSDESIETEFIDANELRAKPPSRFFTRAASIEAHVLNADGNRSNALTIEVENGPLITRLSRSKVRAGKAAVAISIGGVAFKPGVRLAVNDALVETRFVSETELEARIPAELISAPGHLTLQARNPDGGRSNKVTLRVIE
ncbi:MAG TPA: lamin tail domain-containing protein [Blastocatellia bacterium]|nr:lamin tail domain-containing protein [Blastocatellia bacterium]